MFRLNGRRKCDFRRGVRLGSYDHLIYWNKPPHCPAGLDPKLYCLLDEKMLLREVSFSIDKRGFRTRSVTLVTTLLQPASYCKTDLANLYRQRWEAEINLRHLKTAMSMEFLSSKTPQMIRKEFYIHLLGYNLVRTLQSQAAKAHGIEPVQLSFAATQKHFEIFSSLILTESGQRHKHLYMLLVAIVASEKLLIRRNRAEPRAVKRRSKPYPKLKQPRAQSHATIA